MKYLLLLIPSLSLANYVSETGSVTYWSKADCEKIEAKECYSKPLDADTKKLADVEVDDLDKPITTVSEPTLVPVLDENGLPIEGETVATCIAPAELVIDKCVTITGYEKKLEKQFVVDPVKVKEKEDKKKAVEAKATSCNEFKALLLDSAIDDKSKLEDVQEVTRRLLGWWKQCQQ